MKEWTNFYLKNEKKRSNCLHKLLKGKLITNLT